MDNYENEQQGLNPVNMQSQPEPENKAEPAAPPEQNDQPIPEVPREPAPSAGAEIPAQPRRTRKASPFADSPYVMNHAAPQPHPYQDYSAPRSQPVRKNGRGKIAMRIFAGMLAVALVLGCCGFTAQSVNRYWQERTSQMEDDFNEKLAQLEQQIKDQGNFGDSVSGSPAPSEGLTPGQLYARCKDSVVAISCVISSSQGTGTSSGSGFVLSEDGYIITNHHVIEGATRVTVITYNGKEYAAAVKGYDTTNDLAVLKVEASGLHAATLGSSNDLIIGDMVVAIGNPLGELTSTQTVGYVSGKDREVSTDGSVINMLQTDAAINPGNSGGPLFNMKGEVVGITTAKYSGTTSSGASIEGIGFAIPIDDVTGMIEDIIEKGYVSGAYLGVVVRNVDPSVTAYGVPLGASVDSVTDGSCAQKAGIRPKDVIVKVGDYPVESITDLSRAMRNYEPGDTAQIVVWRSGQEHTLQVTFDERPPESELPTIIPGSSGSTLPEDGSFDEWWNYFFGDSEEKD